MTIVLLARNVSIIPKLIFIICSYTILNNYFYCRLHNREKVTNAVSNPVLIIGFV